MSEFYVEKLGNENSEHVVHRGNCPSLPSKDQLQFIGVRGNTASPLREAAHFFFSKSKPCPVCMAG